MERNKNGIIPLNSIDGIAIGSKIFEYKSVFKVKSYANEVSLKQGKSINSCCIVLNTEGMEVDFDIFSQEIISLRTRENYGGKIIGTDLGIGNSVKELLSHFLDSWDSDDFYLWNINFPGMFFGFLDDGREFSFTKIKEYENYNINLIGMISPNQKGDFEIYGMDWFDNKDRLLKIWNRPIFS